MLDLTPTDPIVKTYLKDLHDLKHHLVAHELGLKNPFHNLLDKAAKKRGWHLVSELATHYGGKRIVPDGTVRDEFLLPRGWWEAKDTSDNLTEEIQKKLKAGYPTRNIIFEDTQQAVLFQDRAQAGVFPLVEPVQVADLLNRFFSHDESDEREFRRAMEEFKNRIPDLAQSLRSHIDDAHKKNKAFREAFAEFVALCRASLNPDLSEAKVDEMLIQHLLTERLMRNLFQNPEFTRKNAIAAQVEQVIDALAKGSFSRAEFLQKLDPYYKAIEREGSNLSHFTEKQDFLNSVYEQFFQRFSPDIADTHGIVYTPREIVDYMCNSVEQALKEEFGFTLASPEVVILDPCTGTGNFIVQLMDKMPRSALEEAYKNRLFANEVMLLPYYIASLNIEHAYSEHMGGYETFEGLCFVDTLDMADAKQFDMFTPTNTERVEREKMAAITVIIGNPPYNVGQESENDNNKNRKYKVVNERIRATYSKDSKASSKSKLDDAYVKFFRWATDRLGERDGIICFVSNNGFLHGIAFDGFRRHLLRDFSQIDHFDLRGNARTSGERRREEGGNVFDDQIRTGIGITLAVRRKGAQLRLRYYVVASHQKSAEKRRSLAHFGSTALVPWQSLAPDKDHTWLVPENADEYHAFSPIKEIFSIVTLGLNTNRDSVVYDFDALKLETRVRKFISDYNSEVDRHKRESGADFPDYLKWSSRLKECLSRGQYAAFEAAKIRRALYRPFAKRWVFFDSILNQRLGHWPKITGPVVLVSDIGWRAPSFSALMTNTIADFHLCAPVDAHQCFPLSHLKDSAVETFRTHYSTPTITKVEIFHYIYAILHHPEYRTRYAANLKRELPRVPFAPDFQFFADAGKKLAKLHVEYESLPLWPLKQVENKEVKFTQRVTKMKLAKDKQSLYVNDSLTLSEIPPETFGYRLGSRSALEWIVDQYQVKGDSDPNREDDPAYIIRLIGQVVRVSIETVAIVKSLPNFLA